MSRQQWLSIIGVWVMVFLFLGFPAAWDKIIAIITGLLIIFISFKMHTMHMRHFSEDTNATYVENGGENGGKDAEKSLS
jgi:hypothetical protein